MTLYFIGSFPGLPQGMVDRLKQVGAAVNAAPLTLSFDHVASFDNRPHKRPLVLLGQAGTQALTGLHHVLREGLGAAGLSVDRSGPYTPHLTLLYDDHKVPRQPVGDAGVFVSGGRGDDLWPEERSDPDGRFRFTGLTSGERAGAGGSGGGPRSSAGRL